VALSPQRKPRSGTRLQAGGADECGYVRRVEHIVGAAGHGGSVASNGLAVVRPLSGTGTGRPP